MLGEIVRLTCGVHYQGRWAPVITWTGTSIPTAVNESRGGTPALSQSSLYIVTTTSDNLKTVQCATSFAAPNDVGVDHATNAPLYDAPAPLQQQIVVLCKHREMLCRFWKRVDQIQFINVPVCQLILILVQWSSCLWMRMKTQSSLVCVNCSVVFGCCLRNASFSLNISTVLLHIRSTSRGYNGSKHWYHVLPRKSVHVQSHWWCQSTLHDILLERGDTKQHTEHLSTSGDAVQRNGWHRHFDVLCF